MTMLATDVHTLAELRRWIRDGGGIAPGDYRDGRLTGRENRAEHAWLDRRGASYGLDEWADLIASSMPWFGVRDADDLHELLVSGNETRADYAASYRRALREGPREDETRVCIGRALEVCGLVERVTLHAGEYGLWLAMTVLLDDGTRVTAAVPRAARRALEAAGVECARGTEYALVAHRVRFVADVEATDDPMRGRARRPRRFALDQTERGRREA